MVCKYILSPDFSSVSNDVNCVEFVELNKAFQILVLNQEHVFLNTYEIASPFWTNFILYDFSTANFAWKNRIMNYTEGRSLRQAIDYDPIDNLIYSWHVHSYTSHLLMFILNATTGDQQGATYYRLGVFNCIDIFYYNKFVYGIIYSEYNLDFKLLLIVANVTDPNTLTFATYQQVIGNKLDSLFVDPTSQRLFLGI